MPLVIIQLNKRLHLLANLIFILCAIYVCSPDIGCKFLQLKN
jgi:hypothetical protein